MAALKLQGESVLLPRGSEGEGGIRECERLPRNRALSQTPTPSSISNQTFSGLFI